MMINTMVVEPAQPGGCVKAIPSKSDAHRLLVASAFADRGTKLLMDSTSQDILATVGCLRSIGAVVELQQDGIAVAPVVTPAEHPLLDCRESGSTLRFLLPVTAAVCGRASFTGSGRLPERPIGELCQAMTEGGVSFSADRLPFQTGGRLRGGVYRLPGGISSQYITGMLLALPLTGSDSSIVLTDTLRSAAYVDITLHALARFGVEVQRNGNEYVIPGGQRYRSPGRIEVDGDWSNGAFLLSAGAIGGSVTVTGLSPDSPQGDKTIVDLLKLFGANVVTDGSSVTVSRGLLKGCVIDIDPTPDLLPALAVVAAFAEGDTRFVNAGRLRIKESDRLAACAKLIRDLGGSAEEGEDSLTVHGTGLTGGTADGCNDHRMVMAATIASAGSTGPITVTGPSAVDKSYPGFFEDYCKLGGRATSYPY